VSDEAIAVHVGPVRLGFTSFHRTIEVQTEAAPAMHDVTDAARRFVDECGIEAGLLIVSSLHTTAGLLLNECETGLRADFRTRAEALVPRAHAYRHDDMTVRWENLCPEDSEAPNGHAHLQHAIFGSPGLSLPVAERRIVLGTWQRILLVEYDRPRTRLVFFQAFGAAGHSLHLPVSTDEPPVLPER
jgi:secondary thiamine-phosphate synthase enzyme